MNTPTNTSTKMSSISLPPFLTNFHRLLEQIGRQKDPRHTQPIEELRSNAAWLKDTNDFAIGADAFSVEAEDVLHTYDVLFHPGDLGDTDHLATAVTHARDLNHD